MATHEAAGQMMGYLYQVRYAMLLLLESENPTFKISIEKFDDIAFEDGFSPVEMIQNKHHGSAGSLTDRSVDLWKTIKVWLDQTKKMPGLLNNCKFLIITTQIAGEGSAASRLKKENRDENQALQILKKVAEDHGNAELKTIYDVFLKTDQKVLDSLFKSVEVIDGAPNIDDLSDKIKKHIESPLPGVDAMRASIHNLNESLGMISRERPRVQAYITEREAMAESIRNRRRDVEASIQAIYESEERLRNIRDLNTRRALVLGRISLWIESVEREEDYSQYDEKLKALSERLAELDELLDRENTSELNEASFKDHVIESWWDDDKNLVPLDWIKK